MKEPWGFLLFGLVCLLLLALLTSCATPEPDWVKITHIMKEKGI